MRQYPPHLERLGIHRPGLRTLPILPPKHVWMVRWSRDMPRSWRLTRAMVYLRDFPKASCPTAPIPPRQPPKPWLP